jgi:N-acetylglucosaminyldiphosphoundecaprenol N-acetyl-beta-D-mannosaminyltransferase
MQELGLPVIDVLGVDVAVGTVESAADAVIARALSGEGGYAVLCNVHVLMTAREQPEVMDAVRGAWAVFPDGAPIAWMQRREGHARAARVGGPDLLPAVVDRGRELGVRHGFVGSTPPVLERLSATLEARFPGAAIAYTEAPLPGSEHDPELLDRIRDAGCHVVWFALGAPRQERWMWRHTPQGALPLIMGVGAAFDFLAGSKQRAPRWMQRAGLEWAHRLGSEPVRLGARYATTNSAFAVTAARRLGARRDV